MDFEFCVIPFTAQNEERVIKDYELNITDGKFVIEKNKINKIMFSSILDEYYEQDKKIEEMILLCHKAYKYFGEFKASITINKAIDDYVSRQHCKWVWRNLSNRPDYNKCLLSTRFWPYFESESKEWKEVNIEIKNKSDSGGVVADALDNQKDIYKDEEDMAEKNNNFKGWSLLQHSEYNNDAINARISLIVLLREQGLEKQALLLAYQILTNPKEAHVITMGNFWKAVEGLDKEIIFNGLYYAMYILKHEETIMLGKIDPDSRCVFKLEDAQYLPSYPILSNPENNPYIQQIAYSGLKAYTCPTYLNVNRRINTVEETNRRFNHITKGVFNNIPFKELGLAISGSILLPCVAYNDLETNFSSWEAYLEYYYPSIKSLSKKEYSIYMEKFNEKKIKKEVKFMNDISDIDICCTTEPNDFNRFREVKDIFVKYLNQALKDMNITEEVQVVEVETITQFNFRIRVPILDYHIELFRISYHPGIMTKNFHLGNVKMWWDGSFHMWNECVMTIMSGVNPRYRWFSCNKTPVDIIMRYAQRGYTTMLNKKEKDVLEKFVKVTKFWKVVFDKSVIMGEVYKEHPLFSSGDFDSGVRYGLKILKTKVGTMNPANTSIIKQTKREKQLTTYNKDLIHIVPPNMDLIKKLISL